MSYSIKQLNEKANKAGLNLVKGEGYFYWETTAGELPDIGTVFVYAFNQMGRKNWEWELSEAINQLNQGE
tara:strand:- start:631 stop:840 length:210 start_codon:yes stop_codon:yes gene_type:complete